MDCNEITRLKFSQQPRCVTVFFIPRASTIAEAALTLTTLAGIPMHMFPSPKTQCV